MKILAIRSISLSAQTADAWRNSGVRFLSRGRHPNEAVRIADDYGYDAIINLGNNQVVDEYRIWNPTQVVNNLLTPSSTRKSELGALLPPYPAMGDAYWIKRQGYGGRGKQFFPAGTTIPGALYSDDEDVQKHVEGVEYRVITVGVKVVQVSRRIGDSEGREYEWVGLAGTPKHVKNIARYAAACLPSEKSVVGWDIIDSGDRGVFVLEGNSCPGVNDATARRIVRELTLSLLRDDGTADTPEYAPDDVILEGEGDW